MNYFGLWILSQNGKEVNTYLHAVNSFISVHFLGSVRKFKPKEFSDLVHFFFKKTYLISANVPKYSLSARWHDIVRMVLR